MNTEKINQIKESITKGDTSNALGELKVLCNPNFFQFREILRLEARFNNLQKSKIRGIIDHNQYSLEINKINDSILSFIEKLETNRVSINKWKFFALISIILTIISLFYFGNSKQETSKEIPVADFIPQASNETSLRKIASTDDTTTLKMKVDNKISPILFNIEEEKKSEIFELNIVLESKNVNHKFSALKSMNIELLKNAIVNHYRIHDILRERNEKYDELILTANNVTLRNESISLEEGGVANGDQLKIIPVYYAPPANKIDDDEIIKPDLNEVKIFVVCDSSFSKIYIDGKRIRIRKYSKPETIIRERLHVGYHEIEIPEISFREKFIVRSRHNHVIIRCRI